MKKIFLFILLILLNADILLGENFSLYAGVARQNSGDIISGATVTITLANSSTPATLYSDINGSIIKANPFLTDSSGNYRFFVQPGLYKITISKVSVGTFSTDYIPIGTQAHSSSHTSGNDLLLLNNLQGNISSSQITNGTITNVDISNTAGISESKLALNFPTHLSANDPSAAQKDAMAGSAGAPSGLNPFVTTLDPRLTNSRNPLTHGSTHSSNGSDPVNINISQLSGINGGTNLTQDLEEENHHTEHESGGSDQISVTGLLGLLNDPQKINIYTNNTLKGTRPTINLIEGSNITFTTVDNSAQNRVDVTINGPSLDTGARVRVDEGITTVSNPIEVLQFSSVGFDVTESPTSQANVSIDTTELNTSGDLSGHLNAPTVIALQTKPIDTTAPQDLQLLQWNNSLGKWKPTDPSYNAKFLQNRSVSNTAPSPGQALVWNNTLSVWTPGDVSTAIRIEENDSSVVAQAQSIDFGNGFDVTESPTGEANIGLDLSEITVKADYLKNTPLSSDPTIVGQVLKFDGTNWTPGTDNSSGSLGIKNAGSTLMSATSINLISPLVASNAGSSQGDISITSSGIGSSLLNFGTGVGQISTTSLPEGTNLYYTSTRFNTAFSGKNTDGLTEGTTNLYYTATRFNTSFSGKTSDNLAQGTTNLYLSSAQKTGLTGGGDYTGHFHASDRNLGNATGTLDSTKIGTGLTDAQINDNITISSSGSIDGAAIKSGTIDDARLGDAKRQFKTFVVAYPDNSTSYNYIYFPMAVNVTSIASRTRGGTCNFNVVINDSSSLTSGAVTANSSGVVTSSIANPSISAGVWLSLGITTCSISGGTTTELSVTVVYNVL